MLLPKKVRSSLVNKIHLPILLTIFLGLMVAIINSTYNLTNITELKYQEIRTTYQNYLKRAYDSKSSIVLTNAITLSQNPVIVNALKTGERQQALQLLQKISKEISLNSSLKNVRIHIHTADLKSFMRSWRPKDYGDDLSSFRDSLVYEKQNQRPFVVSEMGRAGLLLRGIAPIFDVNGSYLGSIEFATGYENIGRLLQKDYGLDFVVLAAPSNSQSFKRFNSSIMLGDRYLAMKKSQVAPELLKALEGFQSKNIKKTGMMIKNGLFITSIPIRNFDNEVVGCLMVADQMSRISDIVNQTRHTMIFQIAFMAFIDLLIFFTLTWMLKRSVIAPIIDLSNDVRTFSKSIGKDNTVDTANKNLLMRRDELGGIARAFNKSAKHISLLFQQIDESQKAQEEYLKAVYAASIVSKSDLTGNITFVNAELCKVTGYEPHELIGAPHSIFRHPLTPKETFSNLWRTITEGHIWNGLLINQKKDGSVFYANTTIVPIISNKGAINEYIALRNDVSELIDSQKKLRESLFKDALTGLHNRFKLLEDIRESDPQYMAICDIQAFKDINDFYGYDIGDQILKQFASFSTEMIKGTDCRIYRLQGDEFALVSFTNDNFDLEQFINRIKTMLDKITHHTFLVEEQKITLDITIGVTQKQHDLLFEADLAHKTARKLNKTLVVYEESFKQLQEQQNNIEWVKKLKSAIREQRIKSLYQPIVNNKTSAIEKYESLVRLQTTDGEMISPFAFLDIAKKARLYTSLTEIMIENVFATLGNHQEEFSINLSMEDINTAEIFNTLTNALKNNPELGSRLVLEIVESESIQSYETVENFINTMRTYGCKVAVDDFGTGYSNFEFLLNLHPDYLKIDGSLIKNLPQDRKAYAIVESIVRFAKKNDIKTIAEFVHSEEVLQAVRELGIEYSQGYLLGKPEAEPKGNF